MHKEFQVGLVWFRRDLRCTDNAALTAALRACDAIHCVFVFDREILDVLPRADRRVEFIRESVQELDADLRTLANHPEAGLIMLHACAHDAIPALATEVGVQAVFAARDYEPPARRRDAAVDNALQAMNVAFRLVKDHVVLEERELLTQGGKPYTVFTPYKRAWLARVADDFPSNLSSYAPSTPLVSGELLPRPMAYRRDAPSLSELGFTLTNLRALGVTPGSRGANALLQDFWNRMDDYDRRRDFPALKGPSYLSVHLRFGTVSIRELVSLALQRQLEGSTGAATWLGELVWRDFYFQILANFPHAAQSAFKPAYDHIHWEEGPQAQTLFDAWCRGATGYPLVDAAMHQLNHTGYMHNRLRMVAGSFLVKHLGVDWRWGERYFAEKLIDFDLAANNGGWQWVSSSGCDAQPYFRIFNPITQSQKFDPQGKFIRRYLPQLAKLGDKYIHTPWLAPSAEREAAEVVLGTDYPLPIVDHAQARALTLQRYAVVRTPD